MSFAQAVNTALLSTSVTTRNGGSPSTRVPFAKSQAKWAAVAALPPLPRTNTVPPRAWQASSARAARSRSSNGMRCMAQASSRQ